MVDPSLYTYSDAYLAPNGVFVVTGVVPSKLALSEIWNFIKTIFTPRLPTWLTGVSRRYALVYHLYCQQTNHLTLGWFVHAVCSRQLRTRRISFRIFNVSLQKVCPISVASEQVNIYIDLHLMLGSLKPLVDSVYSFEDVHDAYARLMSHRATGKVIVKVDSSLSSE